MSEGERLIDPIEEERMNRLKSDRPLVSDKPIVSDKPLKKLTKTEIESIRKKLFKQANRGWGVRAIREFDKLYDQGLITKLIRDNSLKKIQQIEDAYWDRELERIEYPDDEDNEPSKPKKKDDDEDEGYFTPEEYVEPSKPKKKDDDEDEGYFTPEEYVEPTPTKKRSQLSEHFTTYEKPKKPKSIKADWNKVPRSVRDTIRALTDVDDAVLESTWNNFITDEDEEIIAAGNYERFEDVLSSAQRTAEFVPDYLEGNDDMTKEERQIEFHRNLIKGSLKDIIEKREKPKNNFNKRNEMGGGITSGLSTSKIQKEDYKTPEIFNDNEMLLDAKISQNAMSREMFKGIDPNSLNGDGEFTEEEVAQFFANMNEMNNRQDNAEINNALNNIEVLSGGDRDSLFSASDLASARGSNVPSSRGEWQHDLPWEADDYPAPIERGRQAQALREVDPSVLRTQNRVAGATTIALGIGTLNTAYRGIFGVNDIPETRNNDIMKDFNQNMRMIGRYGMYGEATDLKQDDFYEGFKLDERIAGLQGYNDRRRYNSNNDLKDPYLLQSQPEAVDINKLSQSMMFNQGTTQGTALPQLRQQEFSYKQATRKTVHDGYSFIRGGKSRAIQIDNEFEP